MITLIIACPTTTMIINFRELPVLIKDLNTKQLIIVIERQTVKILQKIDDNHSNKKTIKS